jgi:hypothetical protein
VTLPRKVAHWKTITTHIYCLLNLDSQVDLMVPRKKKVDLMVFLNNLLVIRELLVANK